MRAKFVAVLVACLGDPRRRRVAAQASSSSTAHGTLTLTTSAGWGHLLPGPRHRLPVRAEHHRQRRQQPRHVDLLARSGSVGLDQVRPLHGRRPLLDRLRRAEAHDRLADFRSTCDPGVIQFGGYYYIAYTSTTDAGGQLNQAFVARSTSPGGPYDKWNGTGWGGSPKPFIVYPGSTGYGTGEPSLVLQNNTLFVYYTWMDGTSAQTRVATVANPGANWPGSLAYQGVAIAREGLGDTGASGGTLIEDSTDVKYVDSLGLFVAVSVGNRMLDTSFTKAYQSVDGIHFTKSYVLGQGQQVRAHNIGISGTATGHLDTTKQNVIAYAYGSTWGHWPTRMQPISLAVAQSGTLDPAAPGTTVSWLHTAGPGLWQFPSPPEVDQLDNKADPAFTSPLGVVLGTGTYEADIKIVAPLNNDTTSWAGLQVAKRSATDAYGTSGYLVFLRANGNVSLLKAGVGVVVGDTPTGTAPMNGPVHLKVVKSGRTILVYVGNSVGPQITWTDTRAVLRRRVHRLRHQQDHGHLHRAEALRQRRRPFVGPHFLDPARAHRPAPPGPVLVRGQRARVLVLVRRLDDPQRQSRR